MRKVRAICLAMAMLMLFSAILAGCGQEKPAAGDDNKQVASQSPTPASNSDNSQDDEKVDISKEVTLKMYLLGDMAKDFNLVYGELNKMLKEDINATVEVSFMGWGDYTQKYPLVFASGDDFDLIYTANWAFYNSQATKGGFLEITKDMLKKYAPRTYESMYEEAWEQAKVNGKVYMLPMNYKELNAYVYMVRGDLMSKYGITEIKNQDDFEKYLDAVAKNEKHLIPLDIGSDMDFDTLLRFEVLAPQNLDYLEPQQLNHFFNLADKSSGKIVNIIETPEFLEFAKKMKEWKDKGYWSKSALVNKVSSKESFINGKSASAIMNLSTANGTYTSVVASHPEWDVKVFDGMNGKGIPIKPYIQNGMGINANSKNPERALMFLDLVKNEQRYADLVTYGIKGVHYDLTPEGYVVPLENSANYPIDGNCNWGWRDDRLFRQVQGGIPNYNEIRSNWEKVALTHPVQNFTFDDSKVKNEVATVTNLWKTDFKVVVLGFTNDPEAEVAKLIEKYKTAGNDAIIAEQQAQIDAYLNSLK